VRGSDPLQIVLIIKTDNNSNLIKCFACIALRSFCWDVWWAINPTKTFNGCSDDDRRQKAVLRRWNAEGTEDGWQAVYSTDTAGLWSREQRPREETLPPHPPPSTQQQTEELRVKTVSGIYSAKMAIRPGATSKGSRGDNNVTQPEHRALQNLGWAEKKTYWLSKRDEQQRWSQPQENNYCNRISPGRLSTWIEAGIRRDDYPLRLPWHWAATRLCSQIRQAHRAVS